jgi:hypothetical protein
MPFSTRCCSVDQSVTDLLMGDMSPPEEYVGIVEELFT